jgi:hypothetical protein
VGCAGRSVGFGSKEICDRDAPAAAGLSISLAVRCDGKIAAKRCKDFVIRGRSGGSATD